ncbi:MAG: type II secretion system F family protein [Acidimicrobiales bacterium]
MPDTYTYRVREPGGRTVQGSLEADSSALVVAKLREMGYVPLAIDLKPTTGMSRELKIPGMGGRIKQKDVAVFSRQFATMVDAGLSLLRSLYVLVEQTENKILAKVLDEVRLDVERGASLSQALAKRPKAFSRLFVAMVRAGETGGMLDMVLRQLAATIEKQVELRRKIKSAMTYPTMALVMCLTIAAAMLLFVVPTFKKLYATLHGTLPLPTRLLMATSHITVKFFPLVVLAIAAVVFGVRRIIRTKRGRAAWDAFKLRIPVFGLLVHKTAVTRFSRTMGSLLHSGVPILEAVEITKETVGNQSFVVALEDMQQGVKAGEPVARRLANHAVFPPMVVQMLAVGEETGAVDTLLEKVAEFYEQEVEAMVNSLTSLIEPLLIVGIGSLVGSMVISLYLPLFNIIKLIK